MIAGITIIGYGPTSAMINVADIARSGAVGRRGSNIILVNTTNYSDIVIRGNIVKGV